ncbi:hypothetical protein [Roseospira navarrensis]|uniref:Uncharacterized protein n=1 Tax=Roseospira navarrensis TaxID=140058 RepID=A0A7X1ZIK7_9PROT|nr:hypothetical protein [Roseospira navarrensis]MQX38629.1 hypothetical protein [Roseospira navarrensis]
MKVALDDFSDYCDKNQMIIKSVVPLTRAQAHQYSIADTYFASGPNSAGGWGYGLGYGWGISMIVGFAALLQREEEISDEEYQKRMHQLEEQKAREEKIAALKKEQAVIESEIQDKANFIEASECYSSAAVEERKGIVGGVKFIVSGEKAYPFASGAINIS